MAEYVLASPVVSAFILVGLRYVYTIYYFKSKRGFDSSADLAGGCRRDESSPVAVAVQRTCIDEILALGECPPKDLKIGEEWGPEVLNLRLFFLFF